MKTFFQRYTFFLIVLVPFALVLVFQRSHGVRAVHTLAFSVKEMLSVLPPIFFLLGLMDVWVSRETMVRFMGEGSGLKGILLAFFTGSVAVGPLYAAFPVAAMLMRKGASFFNLIVFIGAWSTTKIPLVLFELSSLGPAFALTRLSMNIPIIVIIAAVSSALLKDKEKTALYEEARNL
jgi:uncharacterized membrane protein YraQ (UPF0718 family)